MAGSGRFKAAPADWPDLLVQDAGYPLTVLDRFQPEQLPDGNLLVVGAGQAETSFARRRCGRRKGIPS